MSSFSRRTTPWPKANRGLRPRPIGLAAAAPAPQIVWRPGISLNVGGQLGRILLQRRVAHAAHRDIWAIQSQAHPGSWVIKRIHCSARSAADILREARLQRTAGGLRTLVALAAHVKGGFGYILVEQAAGGTLAQLLQDRATDGQPLSVAQALRFFAQMLWAVRDAHAAQIVHRDIKAENFLLSHNAPGAAALKLSDFGLARFVHDRCADGAGTLAYMAPEIAWGLPHTPAADMFSLGATLMEMLIGVTPYEDDDERLVLQALRRGQPNFALADVDAVLAARAVPFWQRAQLIDLLAQMLAPLPAARSTAAALLGHPAFKLRA